MPEQTAKNTKRVLLINDLAGYGKVALSAMIPIFSHLLYDTCNLPTALVSNTLDYGHFRILDTTDYMQDRPISLRVIRIAKTAPPILICSNMALYEGIIFTGIYIYEHHVVTSK